MQMQYYCWICYACCLYMGSSSCLSILYRWSIPNPFPSIDSPTSHPALPPPVAFPSLAVSLPWRGNPLLASTLLALSPPLAPLSCWWLHRPPISRSLLRSPCMWPLFVFRGTSRSLIRALYPLAFWAPPGLEGSSRLPPATIVPWRTIARWTQQSRSSPTFIGVCSLKRPRIFARRNSARRQKQK